MFALAEYIYVLAPNTKKRITYFCFCTTPDTANLQKNQQVLYNGTVFWVTIAGDVYKTNSVCTKQLFGGFPLLFLWTLLKRFLNQISFGQRHTTTRSTQIGSCKTCIFVTSFDFAVGFIMFQITHKNRFLFTPGESWVVVRDAFSLQLTNKAAYPNSRLYASGARLFPFNRINMFLQNRLLQRASSGWVAIDRQVSLCYFHLQLQVIGYKCGAMDRAWCDAR